MEGFNLEGLDFEALDGAGQAAAPASAPERAAWSSARSGTSPDAASLAESIFSPATLTVRSPAALPGNETAFESRAPAANSCPLASCQRRVFDGAASSSLQTERQTHAALSVSQDGANAAAALADAHSAHAASAAGGKPRRQWSAFTRAASHAPAARKDSESAGARDGARGVRALGSAPPPAGRQWADGRAGVAPPAPQSRLGSSPAQCHSSQGVHARDASASFAASLATKVEESGGVARRLGPHVSAAEAPSSSRVRSWCSLGRGSTSMFSADTRAAGRNRQSQHSSQAQQHASFVSAQTNTESGPGRVPAVGAICKDGDDLGCLDISPEASARSWGSPFSAVLRSETKAQLSFSSHPDTARFSVGRKISGEENFLGLAARDSRPAPWGPSGLSDRRGREPLLQDAQAFGRSPVPRLFAGSSTPQRDAAASQPVFGAVSASRSRIRGCGLQVKPERRGVCTPQHGAQTARFDRSQAAERGVRFVGEGRTEANDADADDLQWDRADDEVLESKPKPSPRLAGPAGLLLSRMQQAETAKRLKTEGAASPNGGVNFGSLTGPNGAASLARRALFTPTSEEIECLDSDEEDAELERAPDLSRSVAWIKALFFAALPLDDFHLGIIATAPDSAAVSRSFLYRDNIASILSRVAPAAYKVAQLLAAVKVSFARPRSGDGTKNEEAEEALLHLLDPTGVMPAVVHSRAMASQPNLAAGSAMLLRDVTVFLSDCRLPCLAITQASIVRIFPPEDWTPALQAAFVTERDKELSESSTSEGSLSVSMGGGAPSVGAQTQGRARGGSRERPQSDSFADAQKTSQGSVPSSASRCDVKHEAELHACSKPAHGATSREAATQHVHMSPVEVDDVSSLIDDLETLEDPDAAAAPSVHASQGSPCAESANTSHAQSGASGLPTFALSPSNGGGGCSESADMNGRSIVFREGSAPRVERAAGDGGLPVSSVGMRTDGNELEAALQQAAMQSPTRRRNGECEAARRQLGAVEASPGFLGSQETHAAGAVAAGRGQAASCSESGAAIEAAANDPLVELLDILLDDPETGSL
ncbi:hypothetical protein BESB_024250 [Besnoitia besnoiti]|uniref:Homologous recombination OB-fold protein OB-fold domain-containing protein n=1 Tax=Besnoitia besnoiti TaxID=94643 RepID=A0A2A9M8C5_BESBE|nr:hypothetical protein BESB_024250 [Besnoitia besnoiti]PFH31933.1 hypothetical protein BESB_024250 [Besnoitia besnoiti]